MSHILNVELFCDKDNIANVYYWDKANTEDTLNITEQIIDYIDSHPFVEGKTELENKEYAVKMFRDLGAGLYVENPDGYFTKSDSSIDRESGFVSVTYKDMQETKVLQDGVVNICLKAKTLDIDVEELNETLNKLEDIQNEYETEREDYVSSSDIIEKDIDFLLDTTLVNISFDTFKKVKKSIENIQEEGISMSM